MGTVGILISKHSI